MINRGDVFTPGGYIVFEGLEIGFDGDSFQIRNNREDVVAVIPEVVSMEQDGTYRVLQAPSFFGNGADGKPTNKVGAGESLCATMQIFSVDGYDSPDPDGDGFCDIIFLVVEIGNGGSFTISDETPESEIYKFQIP